MTWLTRIFSGLWGYVVAVVGAVAAVASIYLAGRKSGKDAVRVKQSEQAVEDARTANEIDNEVSRISDDDLYDELYDRNR